MSSIKSQNATNILERLAVVKKVKTDSELAVLLGVKPNTVSTWKSRDSIDYEKVIAACDNPKELAYVLTGEQIPEIRKVELKQETSAVPENSISVPVYSEVLAAAGGGGANHIEIPTRHLIIPVDMLPERRRSDYKIIFVMGDSMEPTLRPREPIVIDFGVRSIMGNGVYVIRIDGELFVKRLDKLPDGTVEVISDNKIYRSFTIKPESGLMLDIVGKVVLHIKVI